MFKTLLRTFLFATVAAPGLPAWGAVERETFELFVTLPTIDFHVIPVDPQLVEREQRMAFSSVTAGLIPLRANYEVKNANGAIDARLAEEPYLSNGRERIDLRVLFNNVQLSLDPVRVVSAAEARPGRRVGLEIIAVKTDEEYVPGEYLGTVHMVFDAVAP